MAVVEFWPLINMKRGGKTVKTNGVISRIIIFLLIAAVLSISTTVFALSGDPRPLQQSSLPQITFLGEGPGTFTVEPPLELLVKTYIDGVFLFVPHTEPSYEARSGERVWTIDFVPDEPMRLFDEGKSYGNVAAGCVVNYVQIEDNLDTRRNTFFINGNVLQVVEQGMVTYGSFTVPEDGELTFFAEDSIGLVVELCQSVQTVVPISSPTVPGTAIVSPSLTVTVGPGTSTPTNPPALTPTVTQPTLSPSVTQQSLITPTLSTPDVIIEPSNTPTTAPTFTATVPGGPKVTEPPAASTAIATATSRPTIAAQVIVITATPISTPGAIPVTGGVPGPREVAAISAVLIGLFGLVGAGWWFLLRAYGNGR